MKQGRPIDKTSKLIQRWKDRWMVTLSIKGQSERERERERGAECEINNTKLMEIKKKTFLRLMFS